MAEKSRWSLGAKLKGIFGIGADDSTDEPLDDGIAAPPRNVVDEVAPAPAREPEPVVAAEPASVEPVAAPEPATKPEPAAKPEPVATPEPAPAAPAPPAAAPAPAPAPAKAAPVVKKPAKVSRKITITEETWDDLEATLLTADFGPDLTEQLIDVMRANVAKYNTTDPDDFVRMLREAIEERLAKFDTTLKLSERPAVVLVVGVNGVGKTTTIGKFAKFVANAGKSVVVGAADTFRAAAVEQVATWAERAGVDIVRPQMEGQDPSAVAYQTVEWAINNGTEIVIIDTAGRLQTKSGLMDELSKIRRVIEKQAPIAEVLLVLDATTGQNGLSQAEAFLEHAGVTGLVLTKLDGSAKGGFVLAVQERTGIPVKLVGSGEGINDLQGFSPVAFAAQLVG